MRFEIEGLKVEESKNPIIQKEKDVNQIMISYELAAPLLPDSSYSLEFLPGAFTTFGGLTNDTTKLSFKVKTEDKYGSIKLNLEGLQQHAIVQLLKGKDKVVVERRLDQSDVLLFTYLKPGKYNIKLIFDQNNNGKWDPGRYLHGLQPEGVLYYHKELELKANWEMEESWSLDEE